VLGPVRPRGPQLAVAYPTYLTTHSAYRANQVRVAERAGTRSRGRDPP